MAIQDLLDALADTEENRQKFFDYLKSRPYPHFEQDPDGTLVMVEEDGTRTRGFMKDRKFHPL